MPNTKRPLPAGVRPISIRDLKKFVQTFLSNPKKNASYLNIIKLTILRKFDSGREFLLIALGEMLKDDALTDDKKQQFLMDVFSQYPCLFFLKKSTIADLHHANDADSDIQLYKSTLSTAEDAISAATQTNDFLFDFLMRWNQKTAPKFLAGQNLGQLTTQYPGITLALLFNDKLRPNFLSYLTTSPSNLTEFLQAIEDNTVNFKNTKCKNYLRLIVMCLLVYQAPGIKEYHQQAIAIPRDEDIDTTNRLTNRRILLKDLQDPSLISLSNSARAASIGKSILTKDININDDIAIFLANHRETFWKAMNPYKRYPFRAFLHRALGLYAGFFQKKQKELTELSSVFSVNPDKASEEKLSVRIFSRQGFIIPIPVTPPVSSCSSPAASPAQLQPGGTPADTLHPNTAVQHQMAATTPVVPPLASNEFPPTPLNSPISSEASTPNSGQRQAALFHSPSSNVRPTGQPPSSVTSATKILSHTNPTPENLRDMSTIAASPPHDPTTTATIQ